MKNGQRRYLLLVTGIASNTDASIRLVERIADVPALNLMDRCSLPELDSLLEERFGRGADPAESGVDPAAPAEPGAAPAEPGAE